MMADYKQDNRPLRITTPLGDNVLLLERFRGDEAVSAPFRFRLDLLSLDPAVKPDALLGKPVTVEIHFGGHIRYIGGVISRFSQGDRGINLTRYRAEMVPHFWVTSLVRNSRVFQQMKVPDIITDLLKDLKIKHRLALSGQYEPRNYCTQYRETDLHFISRLMEEEGIHYFHSHSKDGHELVLSDISQQNPECPAIGSRFAVAPSGGQPLASEDPLVYDLEREESYTTGTVRLWDHHFELPGKNLEAERTMEHGDDALEAYDYPGGYAARFDGIDPGGGEQASELQKVFQENARVAGIRAREVDTPQTVLRGSNNCALLTPGHHFTLEKHYRRDFNGKYLVTSVHHDVAVETYEDEHGAPFRYASTFTCIPDDRPFAPPRSTSRARVEGSHTAVVVGPSGAEIFTDKYGRVKVQFNWDREGKKDSASSCWIRVSTPWAGRNWGMIAIPRIGQEVVVDFLEGDPDRPLITGMVYNAENMPPYQLPDHMTQSGIKTRSTQEGSPDTFNELRFEDKKGAELVRLHAERNLSVAVEQHEIRTVGKHSVTRIDGARGVVISGEGEVSLDLPNEEGELEESGEMIGDYLEVEKNRYTYVGQGELHEVEKGLGLLINDGDHLIQLRDGNQEILLDNGDQDVTLSNGNQTITLSSGDQTTKLENGNQTIKLSKGNRKVEVSLGKSSEEAMQSIELKVGQNSIKVDQTGVTIKGLTVKIEGQMSTELKGLMTQVKGDGMLIMKGGITMIN